MNKRLWLGLLLSGWSSLLWAIGPGDLTTLFTNLLSDTDLSLSYLGQLTGDVTGLSLSSDNPFMGSIFRIFNGVVLALVLFVVLVTMVISLLTTAQHGEVMGKKWSSIWVPTRAALGMAVLVPTTSGYSYIQVFILWLIMQGVAGANALWGIILDNFESGQSINTVTVVPAANIQGDANIQQLFQSSVCAEFLNQTLTEEYSNPNPSKRIVGNALNGELVTIQQPTDNVFLFTTDSLARDFAENPSDPNQLIKSNVCGAVTLQNSSSDLAQMATIKNNFKIQTLTLLSGMHDLASKVVLTYMQTQSEQARSDQQYAIATKLIADQNAAADALAAQNQKPPPPHLPNPPTPDLTSFADRIRTLGSFEVQPAVALVAAAWGKLTGPMILPVNSTTDESIQARKNGWIFAGSYYFKMAAQKSALTSAAIPPKIIGPNTDSIFAQNLGASLINNYISSSNIKTININDTWTSLLQFYDPNASAPRDKMAGIDSYPGSNPLGQLGSALSGIADKFSEYLHSNQGDPMASMAKVGGDIINMCEQAWIWGAIALIGVQLGGSIMRCMSSAGFAIDAGVRWIVMVFGLLMVLLWSVGASLGIYVPLIPFIVYTASVLGWLIGAIEATIAAPLIAIGLATPSEDEFGKAAQSLMLMVNAFLRPGLIIIGFAAGSKLLIIGFKMLTFSFSTTRQAVLPELGFFGIIAFIGIYSGLALAITHRAFSLIYLIPDKVIRWIGGHGEDSDAASFLQKAEGHFQKGSASAGAAGKAVYGSFKKKGKAPTSAVGGKMG